MHIHKCIYSWKLEALDALELELAVKLQSLQCKCYDPTGPLKKPYTFLTAMSLFFRSDFFLKANILVAAVGLSLVRNQTFGNGQRRKKLLVCRCQEPVKGLGDGSGMWWVWLFQFEQQRKNCVSHWSWRN